MARQVLLPAGVQAQASRLQVSPGILSGNHVFLTGVTGCDADGEMPDALSDRFRRAFDKIGIVLREANLSFGAIVEMTSYHVGLPDHFELFSSVRAEYVQEPYPAWTAIEVAALRRKGAAVEIRVVATIEND